MSLYPKGRSAHWQCPRCCGERCTREVDEEGRNVSQKEESALLPWEQIYKMVATKHNVLVYSSRINAYVIPRAIAGESYAALQTQAAAHLPAYRLKMK